MTKLTIATLQTHIIWEDVEANLALLEQQLLQLTTPVDLIVLPETFTTGFSMQIALAQSIDGKAMQWMEKMAKLKNAAIVGSMMMHDKHGDVFNRLIWMMPEGTYYAYNKRHLFTMGNEPNYFKRGNQQLVIQFKGFAIKPIICYDLRFPVWIRYNPHQPFDVLLVVANWPEKRAEHWNALLKARAIENQAYVVAVNRVGADGNGINHSGDTCVIHPNGTELYRKTHQPHLAIHTIDLDEVKKYRSDFPALADSDSFELNL